MAFIIYIIVTMLYQRSLSYKMYTEYTLIALLRTQISHSSISVYNHHSSSDLIVENRYTVIPS